MIDIAIIDDEPNVRKLLRTIIGEQIPFVNVVGEANGVAAGLDLISKKNPDALLLDVEMGDGSGFDLLEQLKDQQPYVIFVTAYDQYAVQALRAHAIDYVEKPVSPSGLIAAFERLQQQMQNDATPSFPKISQSIRSEIEQRIAIPERTGLRYLNASQILCVKADGMYTELLVDGEEAPIVLSRTLKQVLPQFEKLGFVRVHRSYLVNMRMIQEISRRDGLSVILMNGMNIPFSKSHRDEAMEVISRFTTLL